MLTVDVFICNIFEISLLPNPSTNSLVISISLLDKSLNGLVGLLKVYESNIKFLTFGLKYFPDSNIVLIASYNSVSEHNLYK